MTDLPVIKNYEGNKVQPSKLHFIDQDWKSIFLDRNDPTKFYEYDLEKRKVVREY